MLHTPLSIQQIVSVLPSADVERDVEWYAAQAGFDCVFADNMYAVLRRSSHYLHLQWHADTPEDPLNGGTVIRIFVNDIQSWWKEFFKRGTISSE